MAFDLMAQLTLEGPKNIKKVIGNIQKDLSGLKADVDVRLKLPKSVASVRKELTEKLGAIDLKVNLVAPSAASLESTAKAIRSQFKNIEMSVKVSVDSNSTKDLQALNLELATLNNISTNISKTIKDKLNPSVNSLRKDSIDTAKSLKTANEAAKKLAKGAKDSADDVGDFAGSIRDFGIESALAIKRFGAFTVATAGFFGFFRSIKSNINDAISFQREIVRVGQVSGATSESLSQLRGQIIDLSSSLGVSRSELAETATFLAQAGKRGAELNLILNALAKSQLAPTFGDIAKTREGVIAALNQFTIAGSKTEEVLGSINRVSKEFAVSSDEIISAIKRAGGVFATAANQSLEPIEKLQQLEAVFTSVIDTTRESADTVATGLRTIFSRVQRPRVIEVLKQLNVELLDTEGQFIGTFEALGEISKQFNVLFAKGDTITIAKLVEELGGIRQVGKLIPALRNFGTVAKDALQKAKDGAAEGLGEDVAKAVLTLEQRFKRLGETFSNVIENFTSSKTFTTIANTILFASESVLKLTDSLKPLLPILTSLATIKLTNLAVTFGRGFGEALRDPENKFGFGFGRRAGGSPRSGFNTGGIVPGEGNRDTVPAMLTPGEFVINKKSAQAIGLNNLRKLNKVRPQFLNKGGSVGGVQYLNSGSDDFVRQNQDGSKSVETNSLSNLISSIEKLRGSIDKNTNAQSQSVSVNKKRTIQDDIEDIRANTPGIRDRDAAEEEVKKQIAESRRQSIKSIKDARSSNIDSPKPTSSKFVETTFAELQKQREEETRSYARLSPEISGVNDGLKQGEAAFRDFALAEKQAEAENEKELKRLGKLNTSPAALDPTLVTARNQIGDRLPPTPPIPPKPPRVSLPVIQPAFDPTRSEIDKLADSAETKQINSVIQEIVKTGGNLDDALKVIVRDLRQSFELSGQERSDSIQSTLGKARIAGSGRNVLAESSSSKNRAIINNLTSKGQSTPINKALLEIEQAGGNVEDAINSIARKLAAQTDTLPNIIEQTKAGIAKGLDASEIARANKGGPTRKEREAALKSETFALAKELKSNPELGLNSKTALDLAASKTGLKLNKPSQDISAITQSTSGTSEASEELTESLKKTTKATGDFAERASAAAGGGLALLIGLNSFDLKSFSGIASAFVALGPALASINNAFKGSNFESLFGAGGKLSGFIDGTKDAAIASFKDTFKTIPKIASSAFKKISEIGSSVFQKVSEVIGRRGSGSGGISNAFIPANLGKTLGKLTAGLAITTVLNPIIDSLTSNIFGGNKEIEGVRGTEGRSTSFAAFGGATSGAAKGALAGSFIPIIGTGIGAILGAVAGGLTAGSEQAAFDALKSLGSAAKEASSNLALLTKGNITSKRLSIANESVSNLNQSALLTSSSVANAKANSNLLGLGGITRALSGFTLGPGKKAQAQGLAAVGNQISDAQISQLSTALDNTAKAFVDSLGSGDVLSSIANENSTFNQRVGAIKGTNSVSSRQFLQFASNSSATRLTNTIGDRIAEDPNSSSNRNLAVAFNKISSDLGGDLAKGFSEVDKNGKLLIETTLAKSNLDLASISVINEVIESIKKENDSKFQAAAAARVVALAAVEERKQLDLLATALEKLGSRAARINTDLDNSLTNLRNQLNFQTSDSGGFFQEAKANPFDNLSAATPAEIRDASSRFEKIGQQFGGDKGAQAFSDFGNIAQLQSSLPSILEKIVRDGTLTNQTTKEGVSGAILQGFEKETGVSADALPAAVVKGLDASLTKIFGGTGRQSGDLGLTGENIKNQLIDSGVLKDFLSGPSEQFAKVAASFIESLNKIDQTTIAAAADIAELGKRANNVRLTNLEAGIRAGNSLNAISGREGQSEELSLKQRVNSIRGGGSLFGGDPFDAININVTQDLNRRRSLLSDRNNIQRTGSGALDVTALTENTANLNAVNSRLKLVADNTSILSKTIEESNRRRQETAGIRNDNTSLAKEILRSRARGGVPTKELINTVTNRQATSDVLSGRTVNQSQAIRVLEQAGTGDGLQTLKTLARPQLEKLIASGEVKEGTTVEGFLQDRLTDLSKSLTASLGSSSTGDGTIEDAAIKQLAEGTLAFAQLQKEQADAEKEARDFAILQAKIRQEFGQQLIDGGDKLLEAANKFQQSVDAQINAQKQNIVNETVQLRGEKGGIVEESIKAANSIEIKASDKLIKVSEQLEKLPENIRTEIGGQLQLVVNSSELFTISPTLEKAIAESVAKEINKVLPKTNTDGTPVPKNLGG